MTDQELKLWLAAKKEAGKLIDPETAEVTFDWGLTTDPYGVMDDPSEVDCVGRNYFFRNPGSDIWVWDGDLPAAVLARLWERIDAGDLQERNELPW
jgi:hypothetical protein